MKKRLLTLLRKGFGRRVYTTERQRIGFSQSTRETVNKEVEEKIANKLAENKALFNIENKKGMELTILQEILAENPTYYTDEELLLLLGQLA